MFQELHSFFSSGAAVGAAALGMVLTMFKAANILGNTMELHERFFVRKRHKRLQELRSSINDGPFARYFDEAIKLEAFRIEFGVLVSPQKALVLLKLMELGHWDYLQVGNVARFLIVPPTESVPIIRITRADRLGAWFGRVVGVLTIVGGGALWIAISLISQSLNAYLAGAGLFVMCTFAAVLFATGYGRYKSALSVLDYLSAHPDTWVSQSSVSKAANVLGQDDVLDSLACSDESSKQSHDAELA
jgi:hypothetical protein